VQELERERNLLVHNRDARIDKLHDRAEAAEGRVQELETALREIAENAESWHGPPPIHRESGPHQGHAAALSVIAGIARRALASDAGTGERA